MKFEIDIQPEEITRKTLVEDWRMVKSDIRALKEAGKVKPLEGFERQDLKDFKRIRKALERLIRYYYTREEYEAILGKKKEKNL